MKRFLRRRPFKLTLLAFATALFVVPVAPAMPIIDPGPAPGPALLVPSAPPLTDGWYSAALQQTRLDVAKQHAAPIYRSPVPVGNHGPVLP